MPGHIFAARTDLRRLACDAWLLPTDINGAVEPQWFGYSRTLTELRAGHGLRVELPSGWADGSSRVLELPRAASDHSTPWLTNVGGTSSSDTTWFTQGAAEFIEAASRDVAGKPSEGRACPLLALPIVGTGRGGASQRAGEIVAQLLPVLEATTRRCQVDVVLATNDAASFAAI